MNPSLIETEDGEVLGIYVYGLVNKQLLIDILNPKIGNIKYQWCKLKEDTQVIYAILSNKEEIGSFGVTAVYW